jgi:hypothetical protein
VRLRLLFLLLLLCAACPAAATVRRCVAADGTLIFTDRRCADMGAVEQAAPQPPSGIAAPAYRAACPRTLRDLVDTLSTSIDTRDVNRLASVYQWRGQSSSVAFHIMDRLQAISDRPLVDITAVYPDANQPDADADAVRQPPVALRLEQTLANGVTPTHSVLGLKRALGCWWVSF